MDFISRDGLRADGRRAGEFRQVICQVGDAYREGCDGSASVQMGLSKALATVNGPAPAANMSRDEAGHYPEVSCSVLVAPFCGGPRRIRGRNDGRTSQLQHIIETAVTQSLVPDVLSHSQISISVVLTDADGGLDACAVNAAMLAVADAGIPTKDLTVACTAGHLQGQFILDLNHFEETSNCPSLFIAMQPSMDVITVLQTFHRQTEEHFGELLDIAMKGCAEVYAAMQKALNERLRQLAIGAGKIEV